MSALKIAALSFFGAMPVFLVALVFGVMPMVALALSFTATMSAVMCAVIFTECD